MAFSKDPTKCPDCGGKIVKGTCQDCGYRVGGKSSAKKMPPSKSSKKMPPQFTKKGK